MTGYGRSAPSGSQLDSGAAWAVEIRSVNHRGFDLKIRSDEPDAYCDSEITRLVRTAVERGTVSVNVRTAGIATNLLDVERIRRTYQTLERVRQDVGMAGTVDLATVAAFLTNATADRNSCRGEEMWIILRPVVETALADLVATRTREGTALRADMAARASLFAEIVTRIEGAVTPVPGRFARRLEERLAALRDTPGYEPGRVAQEIALMAERLDVSEELVRLKTHLAHFDALLDSSVAVGRKLDFVIQEMGREINTVGSKAQDAAVAAQIIEGKAELEKIREQAQNIE